jgi:hypothetical protein
VFFVRGKESTLALLSLPLWALFSLLESVLPIKTKESSYLLPNTALFISTKGKLPKYLGRLRVVYEMSRSSGDTLASTAGHFGDLSNFAQFDKFSDLLAATNLSQSFRLLNVF